jgi:antitoxin MazE
VIPFRLQNRVACDYNVIPEFKMKSRIVQIGNSRGVRLPKVLLEQAQLTDEVELDAEPGRIVIRRGSRPRAGWAAAARKMHERGEDRLLDPPTSTRFDDKDWKWR